MHDTWGIKNKVQYCKTELLFF